MCKLPYKPYSAFLKEKYGTKVYKLPVNIPATCPNRDGSIGIGGCTFCAEVGAGFEMLPDNMSVSEQLIKNMSYIKKKYKAEKFIAYFQNYTNTYMPINKLEEYLKACLIDNIVDISISTRPDCISDEYINFLKSFSLKNNIDITIELGLQTANYHTLDKINRGHSLAEYIDACIRIKNAGLFLCTHIILNLPWDNMRDCIETAKITSFLKNDHIKLHSLYIAKGTKMAEQYENHEFELCDADEYVERVITFLQYLSPDISIQRLIGRAPEEFTIFANWNMSWWKIKDMIEEKMLKENRFQGSLFKKN